MDSRLACQTEVTPDARDLYRAQLGNDDCDDCRGAWAVRGAPVLLVLDSDETDGATTARGEIISLARAVLALGQRGSARAVVPADTVASETNRPGSGRSGQG